MSRLLWLAVGFGMLLVALSRAPLADVHWDAPIYLYQAKRFAETAYLVDFARNAQEIAAQLAGAWPEDESYSEAFWRSSRLGHIALLGAPVATFGSTGAAITAVHWIFVLAMPLGLLAWCRVSHLAARALEPGAVGAGGLALSALLFVLSDVHGYLSGNLVSEVVSFGLGAAAVWALLASTVRTAGWLAVLSGVLAFLGYTVRVESVWIWLAFMLAYLPFAGAGEARARALCRFALAGTAALLGYATYASVVHPLADPRSYLAFAASLAQSAREGVHAGNLVFVVGGMLWLGAVFALPRLRGSRVVRFGVLWLLLAGLPSWALIASDSAVQTRMLIGLVPPLVLLSAAGWTHVLRGRRRFAALGLTVVFVLVSRPPIYGWFVEQPGLWRIQRLGAAMFVPRYERIDYLPTEMAAISAQLFDGGARPGILMVAPSVAQEYLNLVRFFGPSYPADAHLALAGDPTNPGHCELRRDRAHEPVRFCSGFGDAAALRASLVGHRVLHLRRVADPPFAGASPLLQTAGFVLEQLGPAPPPAPAH